MIHQPLGGYEGRASDIEIEAREFLLIRNRINQLISDATGQPIEKVEKVEKDTDRNYWMRPQQAIEYGIVGRIITNWEDVSPV